MFEKCALKLAFYLKFASKESDTKLPSAQMSANWVLKLASWLQIHVLNTANKTLIHNVYSFAAKNRLLLSSRASFFCYFQAESIVNVIQPEKQMEDVWSQTVAQFSPNKKP